MVLLINQTRLNGHNMRSALCQSLTCSQKYVLILDSGLAIIAEPQALLMTALKQTVNDLYRPRILEKTLYLKIQMRAQMCGDMNKG